jgi:transcriptional regulator with XRE-family HTH domain
MNIQEIRDIVEKASVKNCNKSEIKIALDNAAKNVEEIRSRKDSVGYDLNKIEEETKKAGDNPKLHREIADIYGLQIERETEYTELSEQIEEYYAMINRLERYYCYFKNFDKRVCLENIRFYLEKKNVKIGQIEKEADVSIGYMSRLEKKENTSEPSIEFVATAAKMLDVTVDELIHERNMALSSAEQYINDFLNQLIDYTLKDKFVWKREKTEYFTKPHNAYDSPYSNHPLLSYDDKNLDSDGMPFLVKYISEFYPESDVIPQAGVYYTEFIDEQGKIFIVPCKVKDDYELGTEEFFEIYIVNEQNESHGLCNMLQVSPVVRATVNKLYKLAMTNASSVHISADAKYIINKYMSK